MEGFYTTKDNRRRYTTLLPSVDKHTPTPPHLPPFLFRLSSLTVLLHVLIPERNGNEIHREMVGFRESLYIRVGWTSQSIT